MNPAAPVHRVKWRLVYPGDVVIDEPEEDASIRLARPGATDLIVCEMMPDGSRRPWLRVPLTDEESLSRLLIGREGGEWRPVFYRKRFAEMGSSNRSGTAGIVFGRGRETNLRVEGKLFFWRRGMATAGEVPPSMLDETAIQLQVLHPEPGPIEVA